MKKLFLFAILGLASSAYAQVSISGTGVQVGGTGTGCPTSGCTLTGPLSGTSATFSGTVAATETVSGSNLTSGGHASLDLTANGCTTASGGAITCNSTTTAQVALTQMPTPTVQAVQCAGGGCTAGTTSYVYAVVAKDAIGNTRAGYGAINTGPTSLSGSNYMVVSAGNVSTNAPPAVSCDVYRVSGGVVTNGKIASNIPAASCTGNILNDTGIVGDGSSVPSDTSGAIGPMDLATYEDGNMIESVGYSQGTPRYVKPQNIVWTDSINDTTQWTGYNGVTIAYDTTNYLMSPNQQNISFTTNTTSANIYATQTLSVPHNFLGQQLACWYYIGNVAASPTTINIDFDSSATKDAWTNYEETEAIWDQSVTVGAFAGWHLWTGAPGSSSWTNHAGDWTNIKYIRFRFASSTSGNAVTLGPCFAYASPNTKGIVITSMDGGYQGVVQATSYANADGIPLTYNVSQLTTYPSNPTIWSSGINAGLPQHLTVTQLQNLKILGNNLVDNYSYTGLYWQNMTLAQQISSIKTNCRWLRENNFGDGCRFVSPPGTGTRSAAQEQQIFSGLVDFPIGFNNAFTYEHTLYDLRRIYPNISPGQTSNNALMLQMMNDAVATNGVVSFLWHSPYDPVDTGVTAANWTSYIDSMSALIKTGALEAVTPLDLMAGRISVSDPLTVPPTTTNVAGTAGTAYCYENVQTLAQSAAPTQKKAQCWLAAYQQTGAAQTFTFPTAFTTTPTMILSATSCGTYNPTVSTTTLTLPANAAMGAETCMVTVVGQ